MAYNRSIPQATDLISVSQGQLLANFQAIDSGTTGTGAGFSRNHITLTDATNGGLHNRVDFYQAVSSPSISGFTASAYAKDVSTVSELCYKNGTADLQLTSSALVVANGEGFIGGGLQIRSGNAHPGASGSTVNFSTAFPTACIAVSTSMGQDTAAQLTIDTVTTSGFKVYRNGGGNIHVYYIAVGY